MPQLKHFVPRTSLDAEDNLREFIRMCREDLTVFGADLKWADWKWPGVAHFTKVGVSSQGCSDKDRLDDSIIEFAKAYLRYQQGHRPTRAKWELMALRTVEAALLKSDERAQISNLNFTVFDEAALLTRQNYSPMASYHCGRELQRLARFVAEKHLVASGVDTWKSPIKRPSDVTIQTGPKAKAVQDKKLPSQEALDALAEIFASNPADPKDIFTTSTFAMTMCAPVRISEILDLPADCEVEEPDSEGQTQYGWRFYSAKGYEGNIKWIPVVMVPIAKEAVRRIRALTEEPRRLAKWIENLTDKPYRHSACPSVDDDEPLTIFQACAYLGLVSDTRKDCISGLGHAKLSTKDGVHTLNGLWRYVSSRQPEGFPWLNAEKRIKYSNALFCMNRNQLGSQRGTIPVVLWAPDNNVFNNDLSPRICESMQNHKSIFDRYGFKSQDGSRIKLTSHQARHLITTLANRGGLSQEQIAKWAGRADPKQNRVYNHMSEWEMVAKAEALDTSLTLFGPKGEVSQHVPVTTQEVNLMERGAMHISLWGVCSHDFIMAPCEKFRDCLNCEEHVCIKGPGCNEVDRLERIKARLAQVETDYSAATDALSNGYAGADRWFEYLNKSVMRLRQLVEILENPQVPDGAQIKLRDGKDFSHLRRVIRVKAAEALDRKAQDANLLSDMSRLLGGGRG